MDVAERQRYFYGTGRRKTAVARVRLYPGDGQWVINGKSMEDYFGARPMMHLTVRQPLNTVNLLDRFNVSVLVAGGGVTGQAGAVSQGIARALKTMFSPETEHKRHTFNNTVVIKSYRNEAREREKARAIPARPAAPVAAARPATPLVPAAAAGTTPAVPAAPHDPAEIASGMIKKLRDSGYLTRDARMKERKKYGLRGARRGTQFSKR
jgi:small subunit ribosomal protein S9